jgi:hypothetical protein
MELHGHTPEPITLTLIRPAELEAYKAELAESNPDYHHAVLSQLAVMYANRIFQNVTVSQSAWTYNASSNEYTRES